MAVSSIDSSAMFNVFLPVDVPALIAEGKAPSGPWVEVTIRLSSLSRLHRELLASLVRWERNPTLVRFMPAWFTGVPMDPEEGFGKFAFVVEKYYQGMDVKFPLTGRDGELVESIVTDVLANCIAHAEKKQAEQARKSEASQPAMVPAAKPTPSRNLAKKRKPKR